MTPHAHFVETHCHLNFSPLIDDAEAVLKRAFAVGVEQIVVPAYDYQSWQDLPPLGRLNGVRLAFGLHPWASTETLDRDQLEALLGEYDAVAIGEIGLDFKIEGADHDRQIEIFSEQLQLASDLDLPVILHCRGAFEEMFSVLANHGGSIRGVIHAFSRGPQLAQRFREAGLFLGLGGAITRPRARRARRSAEIAPLDRVLLETDAPSIGLDEVPPEETEPRHVADIAAALAALRGQSIAEVACATSENARRLFRL